MKNIIKIIFENITTNVYKVSMMLYLEDNTNLPSKKLIETLRINDNYYVDPISREALSHYNFWMTLKDFIGNTKPYFICNNECFLRKLYNEYCEVVTCEPKENHWPFNKSI